MEILMRKVFRMFILLILIVSTIGCFIGVLQISKSRNLYKTYAKITSIGLPDGAIYGDFTDEEGKTHSDEYLFTDSNFTEFFAIKRVSDE